MYDKFQDRKHAGKKLAEELIEYKNHMNVLLLALPRGGVPVAFEISKELLLPLDVLLVRKLGVPGQEELAMGAIASGDVRFINKDIIKQLDIPDYIIDRVVEKEQKELQRRNALYRNRLPFPKVEDKTVIVVDDGLATGATMKVAIEVLRKEKADKIIVAVPVTSASAHDEIEQMIDKLVCLHTPEPFYGVGQWYMNFSQTTDKDVQQLLAISRKESVSA